MWNVESHARNTNMCADFAIEAEKHRLRRFVCSYFQ